MKKYFIILIFQLLLSNNITKYEVSLYKIPMANVTINYEKTIFKNKEAISLKFETQTNKFASTIFKVNNAYETIIEPNNFNILSFQKITYQPGLRNELNTINKNNNVIYENTNSSIIIPKNYFNIFSLLYYLTVTPFEEIKENINLEREGLLYSCIINKKETETVYEYELIFKKKLKLPHRNQTPIIKDTDLFTWAIFKENSYKKVIVHQKTNTIKSCIFSFGLTNLEAKIQ